MAGGHSDEDMVLSFKELGILCMLLALVLRVCVMLAGCQPQHVRLRGRLNDMRRERYAIDVEFRGELSAPTPTEDRDHRAYIERLCRDPEYRAKLAAVKSHRAAMVGLIISSKAAGVKVRKAELALQAARKAAAGGVTPVGSETEALSVAKATERLGAAAEARIHRKDRLTHVSALHKKAMQEARQVRLWLMQPAGNRRRRPGPTANSGGAAVAAAAATSSDPRVAGGREAGALLGGDRSARPKEGGLSVGIDIGVGGVGGGGGGDGAANTTPAAKTTKQPMEMDMDMPADHHALEEGRRLL